jgi:hypothetical protein
MSDDMIWLVLSAWCGLGGGIVLRWLDHFRWQLWTWEMDREWQKHLSDFHHPTPDGMCLGCGKRHFNAVPMEFARRVAAIDRGEWP